MLEIAEKNAEENGRQSDYEITRDYWLREFPGLAEETRSVIVSTFTSMADCFLRGLLRRLFCTDLNFSPEDTFNGKIIVLNLPVKEFNEIGQFAQVLFKETLNKGSLRAGRDFAGRWGREMWRTRESAGGGRGVMGGDSGRWAVVGR